MPAAAVIPASKLHMKVAAIELFVLDVINETMNFHEIIPEFARATLWCRHKLLSRLLFHAHPSAFEFVSS